MPAVFRSLSARIILILVGGILSSTLLTLGLAYSERQSLIREFRQTQVVERVAQFAMSAEKVDPALLPAFLKAGKGIGILAEPAPADAPAMPDRSELAVQVAERLPEGYRVASAAADPSLCPQRAGHGMVTISVRDSGPGIPEAELAKVFDPFYRLESSRSRQTGGTGLGLAIARNIAEQHGGKIALRNLPQGGLEALLTLPG